jgi:hypothetical protein
MSDAGDAGPARLHAICAEEPLLEETGPAMPSLMPPEVGRAIDTLTAFRSVTAIEIYRAIRESLEKRPVDGREFVDPEQ